MRAVMCKAYGPPESLVVENVPSPVPGQGQVLVDVAACGVNFPDLLVIQNKYQFKPPLPFSPGAEIAGRVAALGEGVSGVKVGDRVIGSTVWGGFAEQTLVDAARLIPVPDSMPLTIASAFILTYGTSIYALKDRAQLKPGETLLVLGAAGGVGLSAVEIGKVMGARVIAAASSPDKLEICRQHGADEVIDYSNQDLRERLKTLAPEGVDVVYDPVGGAYSEPALRSIAWEGRFLVIGFAAGDIPKIPLNLTLLKGCQIVGVFWGSFTLREPERNRANLQQLMDWYLAGKLKPLVSKEYALEEAAQALNDLAERKVKGKIILVTGKAI